MCRLATMSGRALRPAARPFSAPFRSFSPLAVSASPDRLLTAGLDSDLLRFRPFRLRQRDAHNSVFEGRLGLSRVDFERQRHRPVVLPGPQLVQVSGRLLARRGRERAGDGAGERQRIVRVGDLKILGAHARDSGDDHRLIRRGVDIQR
jgi:hypothetical protein